MIRAASLALLAAVVPQYARATCIIEPFPAQLEASDTVFVATLVDAKVSGKLASLKNGKDYRVNFSFTVRERIRGNPDSVKSIYTVNLYHDPQADVSWERGEELRLVPGDNVLVIAKGSGDVQISFCGPSRLWDTDSKELQAFRRRQL